MKIYTTYSVKIKQHNKIFEKTIQKYRQAVSYLIQVCLNEWSEISRIEGNQNRLFYVEKLCHKTKNRPKVKYDFDHICGTSPAYMRRAAINEAIGMVSSYKTRLALWVQEDPQTRGKKPGIPKPGYEYPCMYNRDLYRREGPYKARLKLFKDGIWKWIYVDLKKSDVDYIDRHCKDRKQCAPTLQKRGKQWFLDFPFEEKVVLEEKNIFQQTILAVDLGICNSAAISVMKSDGSILGRHFIKFPAEYDRLEHILNKIKRNRQNRNHKNPKLWARAKGITHCVAVKTAEFIMEKAQLYNVNTIVFEHLNLNEKIRGPKKQRLTLWRSRYVQNIVTDKAHRQGIWVSHVSGWNTSKLAFDGSGMVRRGKKAGFAHNSLCRFPNGKTYNCDLSASYNIGARYFIREILKSLPERERLELEAKVPEVSKRNTCTFSTLINLNAALKAYMD